MIGEYCRVAVARCHYQHTRIDGKYPVILFQIHSPTFSSHSSFQSPLSWMPPITAHSWLQYISFDYIISLT